MWHIHINRAIRNSLMGLLFVVSIFCAGTVRVQALTESAIISATNQTRAAHGLSDYVLDANLTESAYAKANDMILHDYWAHNSPAGLTPWTFIARSGYNYTRAGENLARGFTTDDAVVQGWMNSPTHRAILLDEDLQHIGIAIVYARFQGVDQHVIVAHYGKSPQHTPLEYASADVLPTTPDQQAPAPSPDVVILSAQKSAPEPEKQIENTKSTTTSKDQNEDTSLELLVSFSAGVGLSNKYLEFVGWFIK